VRCADVRRKRCQPYREDVTYYKRAAAKKKKTCDKKAVRKQWLEALEEQRKELQARIAEERLAKPKMKEEFVRFWLLRFRKLDMTQPEQRQALVDTFINAIYLYDDKVLITFNYKEGTETVVFREAVKAEKSSDMSARGAPDIERQIVRFDVLSLCRKGAAHFLHTVCTFARIKGVSAQGLHSLLSFA